MISDYLTHKIDAVRELLHSNSLTDWLIAGIVAVAVWVKVPARVAEVNGLVRLNGESMLSVLVMFALVGVPEYVAANEGLTKLCPISPICPPVKDEMLNPVASEMM